MVKKSSVNIFSVILALVLLLSATSINVSAQGQGVVINEVESSNPDWIELYNHSTENVDISGWIISDDKGLTRLDDVTTKPFPEGTIIKAGEFLVFDVDAEPYNFGLGKNDAVNLYDKGKNLVDSVTYTGHAPDTLGRYPDGTGNFVQTISTKGTANRINEEPEGPDEDQYVETTLRINEIETKHDVLEDYVEIINIGDQPVDIAGWYVMDDELVDHAADYTPVAAGTVIAPGQVYVFDTNTHFAFGLGKNDTVTLRNPEGKIADEYSWTGHPEGTWSRVPDGTGDFRYYPNTKGALNKIVNQEVVVNEIESNGSDRDWVEIFNNTDNDIDISGWYIKDDSVDHFSVRLPKGTMLPAKGYFVFEADLGDDIKHFNFGLGSSDKVELYDPSDTLVDEHTWMSHAKYGLSRIPNGKGDFKDVPLTKGSENQDADTEAPELEELDTLPWPGPATIEFIDETQMFKEDSSGLDYHDGALWLVDNGTGTIWKLNLDEQGIPSFAEGFENGKIVKFKKDKGVAAPGPDAEGITLDKKGMLYVASERDNAAKGTNLNMILQVDPMKETNELVAIREWNITDHIDQARQARGVEFYQVQSNQGIEAIEWIPNSVLQGKLFDANTGAPYNSSNYSSVNGGLFFVGLEDDGFIYVFALSEDEKAVLVTQIDTRMGMVMGLNYDELTDELWAQADNGRMNILARIKLNATENVTMTYHNPPQELDPLKNNEGFAIAHINVDGLRPVYWVEDGITVNSLKMGFVDTYKFPAEEDPDTGGDGANDGEEGEDDTDPSQQEIVIPVGDNIDQPIHDNYVRIYFSPTDSGWLQYNPEFTPGAVIGFDVLIGTTWGEALANGLIVPTVTHTNSKYVFDKWQPALLSNDTVLDNTTSRHYNYTALYKLAYGASDETTDDETTTDETKADKVPTTGETPLIMFAVLSFILSGVMLVIRRKVERTR